MRAVSEIGAGVARGGLGDESVSADERRRRRVPTTATRGPEDADAGGK
jgi:hypothetical protein